MTVHPPPIDITFLIFDMIQVNPAERLGKVKEYYFSRKLAEIAHLRESGHDIVSLAIGSPDLPPPPIAIETLCTVAHDERSHGYQPTKGTPELRQAIARFYKRHYGVLLDADTEVLPLIGSKEGILHTTLAFVNPGDTVLVPDPGYPTYTSLPTLLGANVVHFPLKADADYQPDFDFLENLDTSHVRMLWTNYPNMPTGAKAQRETYERLVAFARQRGILVVNDNPYSFILSKGDKLSIMQVEGAKDCCIELNSMSKSHNMPGWRVGMLVSNPDFVSWTLRVKSNIDSGTFRGLQLAAAAAIDIDDDWHRRYNVEVYSQRRILAEMVMEVLGVEADFNKQVGMFLWARIPDSHPILPMLGDNNRERTLSERFVEYVLNHAGVFITPGFIFGHGGDRCVRLSLCASEDRLEVALKRIREMMLNIVQ